MLAIGDGNALPNRHITNRNKQYMLAIGDVNQAFPLPNERVLKLLDSTIRNKPKQTISASNWRGKRN